MYIISASFMQLAKSANSDNPTTSISRADMWKALRSDKETGKVSEKAREVVEKIVSVFMPLILVYTHNF